MEDKGLFKIKITLTVTDAILLAFIFCLTCGYGRLTNYLAAGLSIIVFFICYKSIATFLDKKMVKLFVSYYIFHFWTSIVNCKDLYYLIGTLTLGVFARFVPMFIYMRVSQYEDERKKAFLKVCSFLWFIIVIVSTITYLNTEGGGRVYTNENFGSLLGGCYAAAYASTLVAIVLLQFLLNKEDSEGKLNYFIGFILCVMHVITTNSMITTVALLAGCICSIFYHGKVDKMKLILKMSTVIVIILALLFIFNVDKMGYGLIKISASMENPIYAQRIREVGVYLFSGDETNHVGKRISVVLTSWYSFLRNPIFGGGFRYGNDFMALKKAEMVGHHSQLLDCFAQYGLIGAIPLLSIYKFGIKKILNSTSLRMTVPLLVSLAIMFCLNPFISDQTNYIIFLYLPLLTSINERKNSKF